MKASVTEEGNRLILGGVVTADNALALRQQGERWLSSRTRGDRLSVDLSAVESASSVLLSLLLCWLREARRMNLTLAVKGASGQLLELSRLNGVSHWLTGPA
ncbi:phospholipid transport system transporter-binding protein [Marinobacter daqiaonensis]|uniref:Phospholipid transport system transporter-binding protein n=1 Tax=Marinobacter daqiaonensis TaxID=650891 RepID=A0A1I6HBM6_9GAMM|nr:STAS domain-containing protein [Marinobacter daqiaonensis]SFR51788.1 phospholipid transport system transporter-binding protein [Marinobacter daqiaonensis]